MDGVTDHPFRHIQKKYGNPVVIYTEFTSVEGVCHGAERLLADFLYDETQRPIIAQIYGTTPVFFRETATLLCELGFDGIDINMGCPAKNVAHSGAGAALIKTPDLALEIIRETKAGVQDFLNGKRAKDCKHISKQIAAEIEKRSASVPKQLFDRTEIPVSVKTRVGYDSKVAEWWITTLLEEEPAAIAVHGRTLKQQYGGLADWDEIAKGAKVCKKLSPHTIYLGNGDIKTRADAYQAVQTYNLDGVLIGRATFGNPWVFDEYSKEDAVPENHYQIALEHARLFESTYSNQERYSFLPMRKHLGWYIHSIPGASEIRQKIYQTNTAAEVEILLKEYNLV